MNRKDPKNWEAVWIQYMNVTDERTDTGDSKDGACV